MGGSDARHKARQANPHPSHQCPIQLRLGLLVSIQMLHLVQIMQCSEQGKQGHTSACALVDSGVFSLQSASISVSVVCFVKVPCLVMASAVAPTQGIHGPEITIDTGAVLCCLHFSKTVADHHTVHLKMLCPVVFAQAEFSHSIVNGSSIRIFCGVDLATPRLQVVVCRISGVRCQKCT